MQPSEPLHILPHPVLSLHLLLYTYSRWPEQSDFFIKSNQLTRLLNCNSGENFGSSLKTANKQKDMFPSAGGGQGLGGAGSDWQDYPKCSGYSLGHTEWEHKQVLPVCRTGDGSAGEKGTSTLLLERDERQQLSLQVKRMKRDCASCEQACEGQREILMGDFSPLCRKTNTKILVPKNHTHKADTKLA